MNAVEAFRASSREIRANKVRSSLSFAAVSVGVASLLYTMAQTRGMSAELEKNLALMGPGRMTIEARRGYVSKGLSPGLTLDDAEALRRELPELHMVYARSSSWGSRFVHKKKFLEELTVAGVGVEFPKRDWVYSLRGRFLNSHDERSQARVCVMVEPAGWYKKPFWASFWRNESPYDDYAKRRDFLGEQVRIEDSYYTVVGVLKPPPKDLDPRWNFWNTPHAFIPITTFQRRISSWLREGQVQEIVVDTGDEKTLAGSRRRIEQVLRHRHRGEEDFEIQDERENFEQEMAQMKKYVLAAFTLGVVALLAGGIGIMNVTLAAIFSRVREIGIRRAVGAGRADILAQFVAEAGLLGAAGGIAGVALAVFGIEALAKTDGREIAELTVWHAVTAVSLGSVVSALFAAGPAWQASRLDPVEALRSE